VAAGAHDGLLAEIDLFELLKTFSTVDRAVVTLRYFGDLTQPEVAAALGVPEGTVKVRLHRLRHRLAAALEGSA
jgi:RNA polymerase sigma-70 factor (ECF subfamily)